MPPIGKGLIITAILGLAVMIVPARVLVGPGIEDSLFIHYAIQMALFVVLSIGILYAGVRYEQRTRPTDVSDPQ